MCYFCGVCLTLKQNQRKMKRFQKTEAVFSVLHDELPDYPVYFTDDVRVSGDFVDEDTGEAVDNIAKWVKGGQCDSRVVAQIKSLVEQGKVIDPDGVKCSNLMRDGVLAKRLSLYQATAKGDRNTTLYVYAEGVKEAIREFENYADLSFEGAYILDGIKMRKAEYIYDDNGSSAQDEITNFFDIAPNRDLKMVAVKMKVEWPEANEDGSTKLVHTIKEYLVETETSESAVCAAMSAAHEKFGDCECTIKSTSVSDGEFIMGARQ